MFRFILLYIVSFSLLTGCISTSNPIPDDYNGPVSYIKDSSKTFTQQKADIFFLDKIDNKNIHDSLVDTRISNQGRGFNLKPVVIGREVPARKANFSLVGRTHYAAPILAMSNTVYEVKGDIEFTPLAGKRYVVKGLLSEEYCSVWLEEEKAGKVVSKKIKIKGKDAKLGFLQK